MPSYIQLKRADCKLRESHTSYPASPYPLLQSIKLHLGHRQDERAVRGEAIDETLDHERLSRSGESLEVKVLIQFRLEDAECPGLLGGEVEGLSRFVNKPLGKWIQGLGMA
ncbi:hypothetical protein HMPREF1224_11714 [Pseudomonas sp. P179]|nr:hypothetical protein HMPREF1224_11714 [Pseudomonas sp. P179]